MPVRIKKIVLTDFRAFPGPEPAAPFELDGKNLLVYGENGAGKSSLFLALRDFFSLKHRARLADYKNRFSGAPDHAPQVEVTFDDNLPPAVWKLTPAAGGGFGTGGYGAGPNGGARLVERHPASATGGSDPRVTEAALRRACLDYRALLDTNYKHGDGEINFFEITVRHLVHDFPVAVPTGVSRTVGELWDAVEHAASVKPAAPRSGGAPSAALLAVNAACVEFNQGLNQALTALQPLVGTLLSDLIGADVTVAIPAFAGVTYTPSHWRDRRLLAGKTLRMNVSFRTHALTAPQSFLNEARLSALALAIYLAGRLACTPSAPVAALKLMVLDDVLIGLDHANRLPVLDVLRKHFADWQVVLLTHDRIWFEMVRFYLGSGDAWRSVEVFEALDVERGIPSPQIRKANAKAAQAALVQARQFLTDHHLPAAANYARAAFELTLKSFCERFSVPVPFKMDQRHLSTEVLLSAVEQWWNAQAGKKAGIAGVVERVKLFRKVVLNPFSHASPPTISRSEIEGAMSAVEALLTILEPSTDLSGDPLASARALMGLASMTLAQRHAALGFLRAAFAKSLRRFCERKGVKTPVTSGDVDAQALWAAANADRASLFPGAHAAILTSITVEAPWLISQIDDAQLAAITISDLQRIENAFAPSGALPPLDSL